MFVETNNKTMKNEMNVPHETRIYIILKKYEADFETFATWQEIPYTRDQYGLWGEMTRKQRKDWKLIEGFLRQKSIVL